MKEIRNAYLLNKFCEVLGVAYTHCENDASFAYKKEGSVLKIYFEWSNGATDWKNNFDFPAKPYRDMTDKWYAHRGFVRVWKSIEDKLADVIADKEIKSIEIAGYSHGAAIALLCHEYCMYNRPDIAEEISGYGFGAPRVIWGCPNKRVKERFKNFTVVRNKKDLVTHVPPAIFGYVHPSGLKTVGDGRWNMIDAHRHTSYIESLSKE